MDIASRQSCFPTNLMKVSNTQARQVCSVVRNSNRMHKHIKVAFNFTCAFNMFKISYIA